MEIMKLKCKQCGYKAYDYEVEKHKGKCRRCGQPIKDGDSYSRDFSIPANFILTGVVLRHTFIPLEYAVGSGLLEVLAESKRQYRLLTADAMPTMQAIYPNQKPARK